jgi:hypothetical protein
MKLFTQELILSYADQLIISTRQMIHRQGDIFNVSFKLLTKSNEHTSYYISSFKYILFVTIKQWT